MRGKQSEIIETKLVIKKVPKGGVKGELLTSQQLFGYYEAELCTLWIVSGFLNKDALFVLLRSFVFFDHSHKIYRFVSGIQEDTDCREVLPLGYLLLVSGLLWLKFWWSVWFFWDRLRPLTGYPIEWSPPPPGVFSPSLLFFDHNSCRKKSGMVNLPLKHLIFTKNCGVLLYQSSKVFPHFQVSVLSF